MCLRVFAVAVLFVAPSLAGDAVVPVSVCEILGKLPEYEGKDLAVIGRYSFRKDGRWIGEQACSMPDVKPLLWLTEDVVSGPKPPADFELNGVILNQKFAAMLKTTTLGKFRFGTPDYDRWAVVFGRIVPRKGNDAAKASAELVFRGSGVVIFLTNDQ